MGSTDASLENHALKGRSPRDGTPARPGPSFPSMAMETLPLAAVARVAADDFRRGHEATITPALAAELAAGIEIALLTAVRAERRACAAECTRRGELWQRTCRRSSPRPAEHARGYRGRAPCERGALYRGPDRVARVGHPRELETSVPIGHVPIRLGATRSDPRVVPRTRRAIPSRGAPSRSGLGTRRNGDCASRSAPPSRRSHRARERPPLVVGVARHAAPDRRRRPATETAKEPR